MQSAGVAAAVTFTPPPPPGCVTRPLLKALRVLQLQLAVRASAQAASEQFSETWGGGGGDDGVGLQRGGRGEGCDAQYMIGCNHDGNEFRPSRMQLLLISITACNIPASFGGKETQGSPANAPVREQCHIVAGMLTTRPQDGVCHMSHMLVLCTGTDVGVKSKRAPSG